MKDTINCLIPIIQDPMDINTGRCVNMNQHVSTNGYYGYQPPAVGKQTHEEQYVDRMDTINDMDIQFNNCIEPEPQSPAPNQDIRAQVNRKRTWEFDSDLPDYKKRRESEPVPFIPEQPTSNKYTNVSVRQPTHNLPDMNRCMMGHYV